MIAQPGAEQIAITLYNRNEYLAHGAYTRLVGRLLLFSAFLNTPLQLLPEIGKQLLHRLIIQLIQTSACQNDCINALQLMLLQAKSFPGNAFDAVALHRELGIFLGYHQA